jgi:hypothetical protein
MRFKLDENFGRRTLGVFRQLGHDVETAALVPGELKSLNPNVAAPRKRHGHR